MNTYKTHFRVVRYGDVVLTVEADNLKEAKALVDVWNLAGTFNHIGDGAISDKIYWDGDIESPDGFDESPAIEAVENMLHEDDFIF